MTPADEARELLEMLGVSCSGALESRSPIDGAVIGSVAEADAGAVGAACGRAAEAFRAWRIVPAPLRGELVRLLGEELRAAKEPLARLVTLEAGKIVQEGLGEVQEMIDICDFAVGLSRQLYGLTIASERPNHRMMEQWHPLGPVGIDHRVQFSGRGVGVECGAGVGLRRSGDLEAEREDAADRRGGDGAGAESALARFGEAPEGLMQLVQGGRDVGEALVDDPRVALLSATGSTAMGKAVGPRVAQRFGRVAARAWRQQCDDRRAERRPRAGGTRDPVLGGRHGGAALHHACAG